MEDPGTHAVREFKACPLCEWEGYTEVVMLGPFPVTWMCPDCCETFHSGY